MTRVHGPVVVVVAVLRSTTCELLAGAGGFCSQRHADCRESRGRGGSKSAKEIFAENPVRRLTQNAAQY
jgi:hypothetical protein